MIPQQLSSLYLHLIHDVASRASRAAIAATAKEAGVDRYPRNQQERNLRGVL